MSLNPKFAELLSNLRDAAVRDPAAESRLKWAAGPTGRAFELKTDYANLRIEEDSGFAPEYSVLFRDSNGNIIESEILREGDGDDFELVRTLYELVRQSTLRVDELIDRMIADVRLGKKTKPEPESSLQRRPSP